MDIQEAIGLEVIVVCDGLDEKSESMFVERANSWKKVINHMKTKSVDFDSSTRVFHGVLARADVLPQNGHKDAIIAICVNPENKNETVCWELEVASISDLALSIETIMRSSFCIHFEEEMRIQDVYILYGYEKATFIMADDLVNEEVLISCRKTYSSITGG